MAENKVMWNVCVIGPKNPNKPDEKARWITIGVGFPGKKPGSIRIILNAHPIGNDMFLFEREDREDHKPAEPVEVRPGGYGDDPPPHEDCPPHTDDEIPFG